VFESREKGAGRQLSKFLDNARYNYDIAMHDIVLRPGKSPLELVSIKTIPKAGLFLKSISDMVSSRFRDPALRQILEFPVLFLGAKPSDTPAFYSFMNHADFGMGTWHPRCGMYSVIEGMGDLARELGVMIHTEAPVQQILVEGNQVAGIKINGEPIRSDLVVSGADYHHTEQLMDASHRGYSEKYWSKKTFAPSALMFFLGVEKKLQNVAHHTLFFDEPFYAHARSIYDHPGWPEAPLFYGSFPSVTDPSAAPEGKEAVVFLIPLATGLEDTEQYREKYYNMIIDRFEKLTGQNIRDHITVKKSYCVNDYMHDYNSYKGNAYGLANILKQTAFLRPKMKSRRVNGLYFTGQLTVPGPGVPPSLISGRIVARMIAKENK
jgi:phytoene desaturase